MTFIRVEQGRECENIDLDRYITYRHTLFGYLPDSKSSFGKSVISNTVEYGLDESFKLESHYYRSKDKSIRARVGNALISPVTARDKDGSRVFGFPHVAGVYTATLSRSRAGIPIDIPGKTV